MGSAAAQGDLGRAYDGGSAITGFKAQYKLSSATGWTTHTFTSTGTTTTTTITGLTNGSSYHVQVRAANANGDGPWSATHYRRCRRARQRRGDRHGRRQAAVGVLDRARQHGASINDYDVRYRGLWPNGWGSWTRVFDGEAWGQTHVSGQDTANQTNNPVNFGAMSISGVLQTESLSGNQGFYKALVAIDEMDLYLEATGDPNFRVRTHTSKPTNDLTVGTELAGAANYLRAWVGPIAANGYFWAVPASGSQTYGTRYRAIHKIDLRTTGTNHAITGLTNGAFYEVQVRAANSRGDGAWSAPVSAMPVSFTASDIGGDNGSATLTFDSSNAWWYKRTAGPSSDNDCHAVAAGTTTAT